MISLRICVTLRTFVAFFTIEYEYHMQWLLSKGLRHNAHNVLARAGCLFARVQGR